MQNIEPKKENPNKKESPFKFNSPEVRKKIRSELDKMFKGIKAKNGVY